LGVGLRKEVGWMLEGNEMFWGDLEGLG